MPRCNKQGAFEQIQCDNEIVSSCWCVDEAGFEMAGTRAPAAALVNCTGKTFIEFKFSHNTEVTISSWAGRQKKKRYCAIY